MCPECFGEFLPVLVASTSNIRIAMVRSQKDSLAVAGLSESRQGDRPPSKVAAKVASPESAADAL